MTEPRGEVPDRKTVAMWRKHRQDEVDADYLYRKLAESSSDRDERSLYLELADVERRHIAIWERIFSVHEIVCPPCKPSPRARLLSLVGRILGARPVRSIMLREEAAEVKRYLALYGENRSGPAADALYQLASESAGHAETLAALADRSDEPWHRTATGGVLRNVVYGFNDGLTANFGLVAGVVGAQVDMSLVVLAGVAGIVADALSMGASGYLAAKSQREVHQHEIAMEREELRLMPELEERELALMYRAKGLSETHARSLAQQLMKHPQQALDVMAHEELGIGTEHLSPIREGWITGAATGLGALIPVVPFLVLPPSLAVPTSFAVAMASHFAVGAARSAVTGRGLLRSGLDMFAVGLGVAVAGYLVGDVLVSRLLG